MGKRRRQKRNIRTLTAYFTLEAAMVLTMVMGIIVLLLYMMFYRYDRCLANQNAGTLALRGCSIQAATKEEILQNIKANALRLGSDWYIAWEQGNTDITLKGDVIKVDCTGKLVFPFRSIASDHIGEKWEVTSVYENKRILPVSFLRNYRRITGGK